MGKRKHEDSKNSGSSKHIKIDVAKVDDTIEQPYLAAFPGTMPENDTVFTSYRPVNSNDDNAKQRLISGETEKVVFTGSNFGEDAPVNYCNYIVGTYSKKDQTLTITPAPVLRMKRSVKALQSAQGSSSRSDTGFAQAKASLGMAFGTAKAKKQIKETERNAVKAQQMEDDLPDIHTEINKYEGPTQEDIKQSMQSSLPIPPPNMEAETPQEAYDISDIVTSEELRQVPIKEILKAESLNDLKQLLPYSASKFVNDRLMNIIKAPGKKDRQAVRSLVYISYLQAYLLNLKPFDVKTRRKVESAMKNPPSMIIDRIQERYTDNNVRTPVMNDKILCYLFVLCLNAADYTIIPEMLAMDLSLKPIKVTTLLRNLGCKIDKLTVDDRKSLGASQAHQKKATLVAPLKFPSVSRGKRK